MATSWGNWFGGNRRKPNAPREAIVGLREQLGMLEKKEQYLNKKIVEEQNKAKAMVSTNKRGAPILRALYPRRRMTDAAFLLA